MEHAVGFQCSSRWDWFTSRREYLTVIPDSTLTLDAVGVGQRTRAGVGAQTFPTMADPGFTEVTHCPLVDKNRFYISGQNKNDLKLVN